jgi:RsmE family RNA methyltransferase
MLTVANYDATPPLQSAIWVPLNLILFQSEETLRPLPRTDERAQHVLNVLRRQVGDAFDAGIVNGPRGKATLLAITDRQLELSFAWTTEFTAPDPITLIIGLPRPQTARKILQETAALGVGALHFVRCDKAEPSYADSTLWHSGEWQRHLEAGAAQAFCTAIPAVTHGQLCSDVIQSLPASANRIALDNYEAPSALSQCQPANVTPLTLAFGPERGWSAGERDLLREQAFALAHLGTRVLRLETAIVAALAIVKAQRGLM